MPRTVDITEELDGGRTIEDPATLLDGLLVAYRARPLPQLVELIVLAGKAAAVEHPTTGSLNDQHARWFEVATQQRAVDLEWLIANVITGRAEYSTERIARLEGWPLDPRLASGLLALADGKRMTTARTFWRDAFRFIGKHAHPGLAPILEPMLAMTPQTSFENALLKKLRALEAKLARATPVSPSTTERAALARLSERLAVTQHRVATRTADDFLREIWAAPNDDAPRAVFADWLLERGDPRGEFISLQLARRRDTSSSRATVARERALLAKHRREWAAPFEPFLSLPSSVFERGFLVSVVVRSRKLASMPAMMTHPAWATVRRFKVDDEGARACDVWLDHMIALGAKRD